MGRLREILDNNKDKYIQHLAELVAIDTQDLGFGIDGGLEKKGQEYLKSLLKDMGADEIISDPMKESVILKSMDQYNEGNPGHQYDNRYNVYATFIGNGGHSLIFNGHMDTMPFGDASLWNTPPHKPTIIERKMYGLGVCDMKGGLMAAVMAVKLLQDADIDLPGDVKIVSVVDEEGGGNGSIQAAMSGQTADGVVVCEPTDDELIAAHMGFVFYKVEIEGKSNHSGSKWLGVSAIDKAIKLIESLAELEHKWAKNYTHPLLPSPSLNVGTIIGGNGASTVAGNCTFEVCIHYLPHLMNEKDVEKSFTETLYKKCFDDVWLKDHLPKITMYQAGGAFEMNTDHQFIEAFTYAYSSAVGKDIKITGSPAGCDSRIWKNIADCPTIQYGPGRLEQCHSIDEYLSIDSYLESILVYAHLILQWCKE